MATYLYIINEYMANAAQGARYVTRKAHQWSVDGSYDGSLRLAYISDGVLRLEEGKAPEWVKNRWPHKPMPTEKEIVLMLLQADRKSTRLNSSHSQQSRMPSSA